MGLEALTTAARGAKVNGDVVEADSVAVLVLTLVRALLLERSLPRPQRPALARRSGPRRVTD